MIANRGATALSGRSILTSAGRAAVPFRLRVGAAFAVIAGAAPHRARPADPRGADRHGRRDHRRHRRHRVLPGAGALLRLRPRVDDRQLDPQVRRRGPQPGLGRAGLLRRPLHGGDHRPASWSSPVPASSGPRWRRSRAPPASSASSDSSISGLYLILVAIANLATFLQAWKLRRALKANPELGDPARRAHPAWPGGPGDDRPAAPGPAPAARLRDRVLVLARLRHQQPDRAADAHRRRGAGRGARDLAALPADPVHGRHDAGRHLQRA